MEFYRLGEWFELAPAKGLADDILKATAERLLKNSSCAFSNAQDSLLGGIEEPVTGQQISTLPEPCDALKNRPRWIVELSVL